MGKGKARQPSLWWIALLTMIVVVLLVWERREPPAIPPATPPTSSIVKPFLFWANDGAEKIPKEDLRAALRSTSVHNRTWDGKTIRLSAARNETVAFAAILEAPLETLDDISLTFSPLRGPTGFQISSPDIELFFVRYLKIEGVSRFHYEHYDERHLPKKFQRPWSGEGIARGGWKDRPDHDKRYPDIAVPLSLHPRFSIPRGESQTVWADIYVPKDAPVGAFTGELSVRDLSVPVELEVIDFSLPDVPSVKTMLYYSLENLRERYGSDSPTLRDRHFQMAHRHRLSLIDDNCPARPLNRPCDEWLPRLDGSLFTPARGYRGSGEGVGNLVFSIGTYGKWDWSAKDDMRRMADAWVSWFEKHSPLTEFFLYLADESKDYDRTERWAKTLRELPGPGKRLPTFATLPFPLASRVPSLSIVGSTLGVGIPRQWQRRDRKLWMYNGARPATGTFAIEDDGIALRSLAWAQYKMRIPRWFQWESTYYDDFQSGMGKTNVFRSARTFGKLTKEDLQYGKTGFNYSNGEGVLFYPGTDRIFPEESYGVQAPFASLRLKHWRRGLQDVEYLVAAERKDPIKTKAVVDKMLPKTLWEYGVDDEKDPTWVRSDISWPSDPDAWNEARDAVAEIVTGAR